MRQETARCDLWPKQLKRLGPEHAYTSITRAGKSSFVGAPCHVLVASLLPSFLVSCQTLTSRSPQCRERG